MIKNLGSITNFHSDVSAGNAMFAGCKKLTEAILPATLTKVNNNVFSGCISLKTIIMNAATPPTLGTGVFTSTPSDMTIYVPDQSVTAYREASGWSAYAERIWPMEAYLYGIITFADPAVEATCLANWDTNGSGYISKEEAKAVTSLGTVFKGNTEITSFDELVEFENVKTINDNYAFEKCTSLRSIDLSNIEEMGTRTFSECTALKSIGSLENLKKASNTIFYKCTSLGGDVSLPNYEGSIGWGAFSHTNTQRVTNLGKTTSIGVGAGADSQGAFSNCLNLQSVVFPETLTEIGPYCFNKCTNLTSLIGFNNSKIHTIGTYAFTHCTALSIEELSLPYLISLGDNAFSDNGYPNTNVNIKRIVNLGAITYLAKLSNPNIESIRVPSTVTSCANYALANCSALTTLIIDATTPFPISQYFLNGTPIKSGNGTIYVPDASVDAYKTKENWSVFANIIKPISQYVEPTNE
jgi:hypothetical protein